MADPTLQLNKKGEVVRMVSEGEDPIVRSVMEARDSKEEPVRERVIQILITIPTSQKRSWQQKLSPVVPS